MNCYIKNIDIKIGSIFPNESLNTEFKKFSINKNSPQIMTNKDEFDTFFISGIMTPKISQIIQNEILEYINFYVPKYVSCFFNMDTPFSHSESFFFIGIDDDGTLTGIPMNFSITDINIFGNMIVDTIENTINMNVSDNLISKREILSCIEPYIIIFNKTEKNFIDNISSKNKREMQTLEIKMKPLFESVNTEKIYREQLKKAGDEITVIKFKKNYFLIKKLFDNIISSSDFLIVMNINNSVHTKFLFDIMMNFDPANYDKNYIDNIGKNLNIEEIYNNNDKKKAVGTYLHEKIKRHTENLKKNIVSKYNTKKKEILEKELEYKSYNETYQNLYYDLNTHFTKINKNNNYILIKIKFNNNKYNYLLKHHPNYVNHSEHLLSYKNLKKNASDNVSVEFVKSQRRLKYVGDKLDPECFKIPTSKK
jgi:hypothetical protein